jgi:hypothetical protein
MHGRRARPQGLECRFNRGCEPLPPSINSNLSRHRLKVQERKSLNSSVGFFKSKPLIRSILVLKTMILALKTPIPGMFINRYQYHTVV